MPDLQLPPRRKPQINLSRPAAGRMWLVFSCAALGIAQSAVGDRGSSLMVAASALGSALATELAFTWRKSGFAKIKDGSAAASALVLTLLLPNQINPAYAALGAFFAMAVVKHSFGGLGSNWLNPGLGGWLFVRFSWPDLFGRSLEGALSGITAPSGALAASALDGTVTAFFNNTLFSLWGMKLPSGYIDLLFRGTPGIIADRGLLALLFGTIVITAFRVGRSWTPAVFLAVFAVLVRSGAPAAGGPLWRGDVLFALCSGGTVAAAFILAGEPASGAKSGAGVLLAASLGAFLSWVFRYIGLELYGCFYALALINAFTPLLRLLESRLFYSPKGRVGEAVSGGAA